MAGRSTHARLLAKHRAAILQDLDVAKIIPSLVYSGVFSILEEGEILNERTRQQQTEVFVDLLSRKGPAAFQEFCTALEDSFPHLLTCFLLDNPDVTSEAEEEKSPSKALQLGFELALKERDAVLRENALALKERDTAMKQYQEMKHERDRALASLESLTTKQSQGLTQRYGGSQGLQGSPGERQARTRRERRRGKDETEAREQVVWEQLSFTINRAPGYGFGIAVSGGRDNPHFTSGETSIVISDVLPGGPAEGLLKVNDRVVSVNGASLDHVDHSQAVNILKDSKDSAIIIIKRRNVVTVPGTPDDRLQTKKVTLNKTKKKEDYGMKLGYHLYVKEVAEKGLAAQSGQLSEGDLLLKINNSLVENLSFTEAKKLVDKAKDKLVLTVQSEGDSPPASPLQGSQLSLPRDRGPYDPSPDRAATLPLSAKRSFHSDTMEPPQSSLSSEKYLRTSPYTEEAPPRPPLPLLDTALSDSDAPPRPPTPGQELLNQLGHYGEPTSLGSRDKLHDAVYGKKWRQPSFYSEPRVVKFQKQGAVGIRLAGGNEVGIYVAAVQEDSPAYLQGLQTGDQLLSVNEIDMRAMTREEAVLLLLSLQDEIRIVAQDRKDKYDKILEMGSGDSFYIRTHFNYEKQGKEELSFKKGDIFHIRDTLHQGVVGSWLAVRIGKNNLETERGVIPNKNRAEQLAHVQNTDAKEAQGKRTGFFRRRSYRRSKSLNKEHWDDIVFAGPTTKFPAYERVVLKEPGFPRPVVIFGPIADVTRERLLREMPDKLDAAQSIKKDKEAKGGASTIIKLNAIRDVVEKGKHCVLDITPNAVDRLNYAQLYPIVIFLQPDNKQTVKDLRSRIAKGSNKSSRKLFEQSMKLKQGYSHLFTAVVHLSNNDAWYSKVKDIIRKQQSQPVWMSENKMEDNVEDDFLFPMSARLSYASSSEGNISAVDSRPVSMFATGPDTWAESGPGPGRMGRSTSDPSLTVDGQPPQTGPGYAPPPTRQLSSDRPVNYSQIPPEKAPRTRDDPWSVRPPSGRQDSHGPYYSAYRQPQGDNLSAHNSFPRENSRHPRSFSSIEPYATLPPDSDRYRDYSHQPDHWGSRKKEPSYQTGYGNYENYPPKDERGYPIEQHHRSNGYSSREAVNGVPKSQPPPYDRHVHRAPQVLSASREWLGPSDRTQSSPKSAFGQPSSYDRRTLPISPSRERPGGYDPYKFTRMTAQSLSRGSKSSLTGGVQNTSSIQRPTPTYPKMPLSNGPTSPLDSRRGRYSPLAKTKSEPHISPSPPADSAIESSDVVQSSVYPTKTIPVIERLDTGDDSMVSDTGSNQSETRRDNGVDSARLQMTPERERDVLNSRSYRDGLKPAVYSAMEFRRRTLDDLRIPKTQADSVMTAAVVDQNKVDVASELEADENHTVIATARGMFDSNGGVLSNAETGVSIIIPKGAIPEGTKQEIYFKVCRDNNILPPLDKDKGETLLSPLVMCGPHGLKFLQPVELRLPHCASMTPDGWSFALKSSDTSTGQPTQWQNMTLPGMNNNSQCQVGASSVSVLVDHFSWFKLIGNPGTTM